MADNKEKTELSDSPHIGGHKMSSSLKERLKRSSRMHSSLLSKTVSPDIHSPKSRTKTICSIFDSPKSESSVSMELNESVYLYYKEDIENCEDKLKLQEMYFNFKRQTEINEEKLRKLKLVQKHHNKNKPEDLVSLIQKWLTTAQDALKKLYDLLPEPKPTNFQNLINFLQIDPNIIQFNPESDSFFQ
ncbi:uncharacterized protein CEXT_52131 [Caerostris extrusa]|uniref:Swi5-dependent recombination DNA repair protein 1 homolog n=1 Tax=Caerostris extrusa TaxID=172846 RepID=A0AAV4Y534_CAEEX|nr:uncharacterized protein CEXT_52131 [Caerostris extrusa]